MDVDEKTKQILNDLVSVVSYVLIRLDTSHDIYTDDLQKDLDKIVSKINT